MYSYSAVGMSTKNRNVKKMLKKSGYLEAHDCSSVSGVSGQALSRTAHSDVTIMRVPMRVTATTHYLIDDHSTLQ